MCGMKVILIKNIKNKTLKKRIGLFKEFFSFLFQFE